MLLPNYWHEMPYIQMEGRAITMNKEKSKTINKNLDLSFPETDSVLLEE